MHTPKLGWAPDALAHRLGISLEDAQAINRALNSHDKLLGALEAGNELWGWLPFDSGEDIAEIAERVRETQLAAIAEAKGE